MEVLLDAGVGPPKLRRSLGRDFTPADVERITLHGGPCPFRSSPSS